MDRESAIITPENKPFIATRFLPKTAQTVSYTPNDDGDHEKGWSIGDRFVVKTIGGEDLVFDRATGLMWPADHNSAGGRNGNIATWATAVAYCNTLNFAGFTDWRLPNRFELASIVDHSRWSPCLDPVFQNFPSTVTNHWTSTTVPAATTKAYTVGLSTGGYVSRELKTTSYYVLAVRKGSPG